MGKKFYSHTSLGYLFFKKLVFRNLQSWCAVVDQHFAELCVIYKYKSAENVWVQLFSLCFCLNFSYFYFSSIQKTWIFLQVSFYYF